MQATSPPPHTHPFHKAPTVTALFFSGPHPHTMPLAENIKYVREKNVAALLNEMAMHVLSQSPEDPLEALIELLERKGGVSPTCRCRR